MTTNQQYTTATNLQGPNLSGNLTSTQKYFNNFYSIDSVTVLPMILFLAFFKNFIKIKN